MITVERTFGVAKPVDVVIDYLKDFAHAEQWDPGTKTCVQETEGPVEVGTRWHNVSELKGHQTELTYELVRLEPGHLTFVGRNDSATSTDDIQVAAGEAGATITYHAEIELHGIAKIAQPFLAGEFEHLGDETRDRITAVINGLA
jgi:carbon monoxide dehydrogenase subunit G